MGDVILTMKDIDKSFPGVHALDHVNFEVRRGEVHALMGENGAGKSTLMKVLTGIYQKDSGSITYKGQEVAFDQFFLRLAETSAYTATITMIPVMIICCPLPRPNAMIPCCRREIINTPITVQQRSNRWLCNGWYIHGWWKIGRASCRERV